MTPAIDHRCPVQRLDLSPLPQPPEDVVVPEHLDDWYSAPCTREARHLGAHAFEDDEVQP